jgi:hypothetical protein
MAMAKTRPASLLLSDPLLDVRLDPAKDEIFHSPVALVASG